MQSKVVRENKRAIMKERGNKNRESGDKKRGKKANNLVII